MVKNNTAQIIWEEPKEELEITQFTLEDHVSEPHLLKVTAKSDKPDISFEKMLYADAKISIKAGDELDSQRFYGGVITRFAQVRTGHGNLETATSKTYFYEVEIRSPLWPLTRERVSKVYQDLSAKDIIQEILDCHQIQADWKLCGTLKKRPYCLQYRETTFDFVSRLLEDDGVYYFFDHKNGKVVFADYPGAHEPCPIDDQAVYMEDQSPMLFSGKQEIVQKLRYEEEIGPGTFAAKDYFYETSQIDLAVNDSEGKSPNYTQLHQYHHNTGHTDSCEGDAILKLRKEAAMAQQKWIEGYGFCRAFATGYTFSLSEHYNKTINETKWLLVGIDVEAEQGRFRCHFKARPVDIPYRPIRKTEAPRIFGVQTATIVGPSGAEVYLDDLGRSKLQFHWDREGKRDDTACIWLRVSNGYAGKDYGIQWIPRVGHEVLVSFIDGNPDRPCVTGRVYNDFNTPPLGPPEKYQNIIKTIKDNHILFDDDDGKERLNLRAQKDMNTLVCNNKSVSVGNDNTQVIKKNRFVIVEEEDYIEEVKEGNYTRKVKQTDYTKVTDGHRLLQVENGQWVAEVKGDTQLKVEKGCHIVNVDTGTQKFDIKSDKKTKVGGEYKINVKEDYILEAKNVGIKSSSGKVDIKAATDVKIKGTSNATVTCSAGVDVLCGGNSVKLTPAGITLTAGASSIKLTPAGIEITGPIVTLKGLIKHNC